MVKSVNTVLPVFVILSSFNLAEKLPSASIKSDNQEVSNDSLILNSLCNMLS